MSVPDDGLVFEAAGISADVMKEGEGYQGVRLRLDARLGGARIPVLIDVGFSDVVTPEPEEISYPVLLDMPAPKLRAYPRETVVAEKVEAMVRFGMANSRMKDSYDLWVLSQTFDFDGASLSRAIAATFVRRHTLLSTGQPFALSREFGAAQLKRTQWQAFLARGRLAAGMPTLELVIDHLRGFLLRPLPASAAGGTFTGHWPAGGPWMPDP